MRRLRPMGLAIVERVRPTLKKSNDFIGASWIALVACMGQACARLSNVRRILECDRLMKRQIAFGLSLLPFFTVAAVADEGMWLSNEFPVDKVQAAYGFKPDAAFLDHIRLASVRIANGCSSSFVSPNGLVMTNDHCVRECLENLSRPGVDPSDSGFYAPALKDEPQCPGVEINQLVAITDVTRAIDAELAGKEGPAFAAALKAAKAKITSACASGDDKVRCDVVTLYRGGQYNLYKYRRYQDVRLVFAPESEIGFFGGDPDNFEFPRYDFDAAFMRVYENGKPLDTKANYLKLASEPVKTGDVAFVAGNPGRTDRLYTLAQLEEERDIVMPRQIAYSSELRGQLTQFIQRGPEQARVATPTLFGLENGLKVFKGRFKALTDGRFMAAKLAQETALREKVAQNPELAAKTGKPWDDIAKALAAHRPQSDRGFLLRARLSRTSELLNYAVALLRIPVETAKPEGERLAEYTSAALPAVRADLMADAPVSAELERLLLAFWFGKIQEYLGPDDAFVHKILGNKSADQLALELVNGSKLGDPAVRRRLLEGGKAAIDQSQDPMIVFARLIDGDLRAVRQQEEETLEAVLDNAGGRIARAGFATGATAYPDATFSFRISYGAVAGWQEPGKTVDPVTRFKGLYQRATGAAPFNLPDRWVKAKDKLNPETIFNFSTTNDIIGGNSGSPVIGRTGEAIGLAFDGNIHSLAGDFYYDPVLNRTVAVSAVAIREGLAKVYQATRLLEELDAKP